jgi:nitrogen fixation protein NifU and related proteins
MSVPEPELDELYRELILDHYRNPRNRVPLESPAVVAEGYNPLCGDEVELRLSVEGDVISDVSFTGRGCSISQASGSMLTEAIKGKTVAQARALMALFTRMMTDPDFVPEEDVGDLEALQGVAKYPVRVKCATLAWHTLQDGLDRHDGAA